MAVAKGVPPEPSTPEFREPVADTVEAVPTSPETPPNMDDYAVVRFPDGTLRAIPREQILSANGMGGYETIAAPDDASVQEWYLHLADGSIERVKGSDLPPAGSGGTNFPNGFYVKDGHTHFIVAKYPVETAIPSK